MSRTSWIIGLCVWAGGTAAGQTFTAKDRQPTPEELRQLPAVTEQKVAGILKEATAPEGFEVQVFATPPAVNYPVFVAAAPDGTLYVSSDGNGSLDRKPHLGRVLRVRDGNGDGRADEVTAFVPDVDSPRGLVWDGDRLYLLHPPDISVFFDRDGDGVAEERKTLVKGIAFGFKDRPADHSSNGLELGVDGWLYAAIGDFGFMEAVGADGRRLQMRGGGVIRLRPDGSGLEVWADGTRNILEVAVSPLLDGFARDNTNDGGGWDVRFHHFSGMTQHGYPRLFKNFADEILPPLADYGGGSGCGGGWIDEPGMPAAWNNAPFTADWGRDWIYHHALTPRGATYAAGQREFLHLPRVTDLDVDARGAIYAASWKGASFTWVGPEVGYVVRVVPKGATLPKVPDYARLGEKELLEELGGASHRRRLAAQRELVRRDGGALGRRLASPISEMAADGQRPLGARVAAIFALKQSLGAEANSILNVLANDRQIQPWVLRALGDEPGQRSGVESRVFASGLKSSDPRVRKEAAIAIARVGGKGEANLVAELLDDADPVVAHTAGAALGSMRAAAACFAAWDDPGASEARRVGALRVLQRLHETGVVDGVIARLGIERRDAGRRRELLTCLARLHFREGVWKGDSWGTRPDTRGPYYQPEVWSETGRIAQVLEAALKQADSAEAVWIVREYARHRIPAGNALEELITRASRDAGLVAALATQLASEETVPDRAVPLLIRAARDESTSDAVRAQAVMSLVKTSDAAAWETAIEVLPSVQKTKSENHLAERAQSALNNSPRLDQMTEVFARLASGKSGETSVLADAALLRIAGRKTGSPEKRALAGQALDAGWEDARRREQILKAAVKAGDTTRAAKYIEAMGDADAGVAREARETVRRLKLDPEKIRAAARGSKIGEMAADAVLSAVVGMKGDAARGEQLFNEVGCNGCHTVKATEPLKGPFLGNITQTYRRREVAEAILAPSKTIAQGFAANLIELKDGSELSVFVVREAADAVVVRTVTAQEVTVPVGEIVRRTKQEKSLMPEGLVAGWTVGDLASLLDYLEGLAAKPAGQP